MQPGATRVHATSLTCWIHELVQLVLILTVCVKKCYQIYDANVTYGFQLKYLSLQ